MPFHSILRTRTLVIVLLTCQIISSQNSDKATNPSADEVRTDTIAPGMQGSINPMTDNTAVLTGTELLDESFPSSLPIFGSDVRMRIGGYVKADFIKDFDYVGDRYEFELGSIAVEGSPERDLGGITTFHVKQTRLNFDFRSKAKWKNGKEFPMQVFLEVDWFFDQDEFRLIPRMRHAYGVIGRLLVGRSWTNSGDLSTLPGTIDFAGGDALYGGRVAQIRWQDSFGKNFTYAVALEEPGGQIENPNDLEGALRSQWPNLAGNIKFKSSNGSSFQLGLDFFAHTWRGPESVPNDTQVGYAVTGSGRFAFNLSHYKDSFVYGAGFGQGQAHRIIALSWDGKASGVITEDGLTLAPAWFGYAGFNHYWSKSLNSTFSTAWAETDLSEDQSPNTIKRAGSFHANLIWFPYPRISIGGEYMWGIRQNNDGVEGTASRIQFMAKFKFN